MQIESKDRYPHQPPSLPEYDVSPTLKKLTLMMIGGMLINFLIAGAFSYGNAYFTDRCIYTKI